MNSILAVPAGGTDARKDDYQELKARIHQELLNRLNLERLNRIAREEAEPQIRDLIVEMIGNETRTTPLKMRSTKCCARSINCATTPRFAGGSFASPSIAPARSCASRHARRAQ